MWKSKKQLEFIVSETKESLDIISKSLAPGYESLTELSRKQSPGKAKDKLDLVLYSIASAYVEIDKYLELFKGIDIEYRTDVLDRFEQLENENIQLKERIRLLEEEKSKQDLIIRANSLLDLFESRVENLAQIDNFVKKCKAPKVGESNPNFTHEVNTEELIDLYEKAGYKLTEDIVNYFQAKTQISYKGLRQRLITAGVWKGRQ